MIQSVVINNDNLIEQLEQLLASPETIDFKDLLVDMTPKQKLAVISLFLLTVFGCYAVTQLKDYYIEKNKNQTQIQLQEDENATKIELEKQKTEQFKSIECLIMMNEYYLVVACRLPYDWLMMQMPVGQD